MQRAYHHSGRDTERGLYADCAGVMLVSDDEGG